MLFIPIVASPSQTLSVVLAGQSCRLDIFEKPPWGLFVDLYVNDVLIIGGALALNATLIVRDPYWGFTGDLAFFDLQGSDDPSYDGLGTRWKLAYIETTDFVT